MQTCEGKDLEIQIFKLKINMNTSDKDQAKQLNETAVKCRFFAQYWGTKTMYVGGVGLVEIGTGGWNLRHPDFFLELKPLSKITDEDIKQWAYLIFKSEFQIIELYRNASDVWVIINEDEVPFFIQPQDCNAMQIDFLRSKGYAVPFMEYSVDELISLGWMRLV